MEVVFLAMMVVAGALLASRALRNLFMRITPGEHVVSDAEDSDSSIVKSLLGSLLGGLFLFGWGGVFFWGALSSKQGGLAIPFLLISGCIALAGAWIAGHGLLTAGRRMRERSLAKPAVLTVSELPLAPGRRVRFRMERKLVGGFEPVTIKVKLNLMAFTTGGQHSEWLLHGTLDFPEAPAQFASGAVYVEWDLEIPAGLMPAPHYLWGFVPDHKAYRWEFRAAATDRDGKELDSCFVLPFIFPPDMRPPESQADAA